MDQRRRQRQRQQRRRRHGGRSPSSRAALRRKVRELRRLVPAGEGSLLLRTADYIARLRARVELLRALTELCSSSSSSVVEPR